MKFIENNTYTLQTDYYNSIKVVCTYVEDNTVWFINKDKSALYTDYKLNCKTSKVYVWSERIGNGSDYYSGIGQGD